MQELQVTNYKLIITISQIASACLQVHKYASLQVCKFQFFLKITNLQFDKLQVHVCKYEKLPNYQITKSPNYKLQNIKLQSYKLHVHVYEFQIYKKKSSQFRISIKIKIANTCLQI